MSGEHKRRDYTSQEKVAILDEHLANISVTSTDGVVIAGNQFKPLDPSLSRFRWGEKKPTAIVTEACSQAEVQSGGGL